MHTKDAILQSAELSISHTCRLRRFLTSKKCQRKVTWTCAEVLLTRLRAARRMLDGHHQQRLPNGLTRMPHRRS